MIIKSYELKKNLNNKKFFLLYGINSGLIEETIENIIKPSFSKSKLFAGVGSHFGDHLGAIWKPSNKQTLDPS